MSDVKWIKISTTVFDDEKIQLIESLPKADSILIIWFKLLCLAGKNNNDGVFLLNENIPYTNEMLSKIFRRKKSVIENAIEVFQEYGMIEVVDNVITIPKWGKHQSLQGSSDRKEYMREYMKERRSKQNVNVNKVNSKPNVNTGEKEEEKEEEKEIKNINNKRFVKPTVEEIKNYCTERNNNIDPQQFFDYYESKGWMIGKNHMKDWKASVRTWENRRKGESNGTVARIPRVDEEQRNRELDEYIRRQQAGEFDDEDEELRRMWDDLP